MEDIHPNRISNKKDIEKGIDELYSKQQWRVHIVNFYTYG